MIVYGKNVSEEILKSNYNVNKIFLSKDFSDKNILDLLNERNNVRYLPKEEIDNMVNAQSQGIVLDIDDYKLLDFDKVKNDSEANFIVILDHLEDPHNFGAIIRTCECAKVDYIIIPNKRSVNINSTVMKTSSGALINSRICEVANIKNTIESLKKDGFWIVGADMNGTAYTDINYSGKVALVIGNEGEGLTNIVKSSCDFIASIPMKGKINSLNASVACGIIIYEILKSRK
jgi:23S rRNA (guanosine2251-2'-O)-methyltransferase